MVKSKLKTIIGNMLVILQPVKAKELCKKGITIPGNLTLNERLMRDVILKKAVKNKDFEMLSEFHKNYWAEKGEDYFSKTNNVLESFFLPNCTGLIDLLQVELKNEPLKFQTLVEIGTGNGEVLEYLSSRLPEIETFVGIDLSVAQTERNRDVFKKKSKLEFVATDGFDWVKENGSSNMVVITSRGVLEYFTESRIQEFLILLNNLGKIIFVAVEPTSIDHDFSIQPHSFPFGFESSFSHNYKSLFENAGFKLWHHSKTRFSTELDFNFIGAKN